MLRKSAEELWLAEIQSTLSFHSLPGCRKHAVIDNKLLAFLHLFGGVPRIPAGLCWLCNRKVHRSGKQSFFLGRVCFLKSRYQRRREAEDSCMRRLWYLRLCHVCLHVLAECHARVSSYSPINESFPHVKCILLSQLPEYPQPLDI